MRRIKLNIYTIGSWGLALALLTILVFALLKKPSSDHLGLETLSQGIDVIEEHVELEVKLVTETEDSADTYSRASITLNRDSASSKWTTSKWLPANLITGKNASISGKNLIGQVLSQNQVHFMVPSHPTRQYLIWSDKNLWLIQQECILPNGDLKETRIIIDSAGKPHDLNQYRVSKAAERHAQAQIMRLANASCFDDFWDRTDHYGLPTDDSLTAIASGRILSRGRLPKLLGREVNNIPTYRRTVIISGGRVWVALEAVFKTTKKWDEDAELSITKPIIPFDSTACYHNKIALDYRYLKASFQSLLNSWTSPGNNYLLNATYNNDGSIMLSIWSLKSARQVANYRLKVGQRVCGIRWKQHS